MTRLLNRPVITDATGDPELLSMTNWLDRFYALMEAKHVERDQAYADGHADGYLAGFEDGLRALMTEASIALGQGA